MLFEAVYWRKIAESNAPDFEEMLNAPDVIKIMSQWGARHGDIGVVATIGSVSVGAAWLRYWKDDDNVRGHIDESTPTLVIGVSREHRRLGIGNELIIWLANYASHRGINRLSLMVSKDNHAFNLYKKCGFELYRDVGESILMTLNTTKPREGNHI